MTLGRQLRPRKMRERNNPPPKIFVWPRHSSTAHNASCRNARMRRPDAMRCRPRARRSPHLLPPKIWTTIHPESGPVSSLKLIVCRKFTVIGRVQGVFFRVSTRDVAMPLKITGHAVNLPDGSVEVLACGDAAALQELERWLSEGPPMASVASVDALDINCEKPPQFSVG